MQTVPVRDAASAAQSLPSGAQTPADSEALLAQAAVIAQAPAAAGTKTKEADEIKLPDQLPAASVFAG